MIQLQHHVSDNGTPAATLTATFTPRRLTGDGVNAIPPLGMIAQQPLGTSNETVSSSGSGKQINDSGIISIFTLPPEAGPGSTREAWVKAADDLGVSYREDATRGDLIALVNAYLDSTDNDITADTITEPVQDSQLSEEE